MPRRRLPILCGLPKVFMFPNIYCQRCKARYVGKPLVIPRVKDVIPSVRDHNPTVRYFSQNIATYCGFLEGHLLPAGINQHFHWLKNYPGPNGKNYPGPKGSEDRNDNAGGTSLGSPGEIPRFRCFDLDGIEFGAWAGQKVIMPNFL